MATKTQQAAVRKVLANFEVDGKTDYKRLEAAVFEATSLKLDNKSVWSLLNRLTDTTERVSFTLED